MRNPSSIPTTALVPARGKILLTVDQARQILGEVGWVEIPAAITWNVVLDFARRRRTALEAGLDPEDRFGVPSVVFKGRTARWSGTVTYGRWIELRPVGPRVEMEWNSGTGRPSTFISGLIRQVGAVYVAPERPATQQRGPARPETLAELRERLGVRAA
jgi:hypothetical protein